MYIKKVSLFVYINLLIFVGISCLFSIFVSNHSSSFITVKTAIKDSTAIGEIKGATSFDNLDPGDLVISVSGNRYADSLAEVWGVITGFEEAHIQKKNGDNILLTSSDPSSENLYQYIIILSVSFLSLLLASYTLISKPTAKSVKIFYWFCLSASYIIVSATPSATGLPYARILEIASISLGCLFLIHIFVNFPTQIKDSIKAKTLNISYGIIGLTVVSLLLLYLSHFTPIRNIIQILLISHIVFSVSMSVYFLFLHYKVNSQRVKNQLHIIIASLLIAVGPVLIVSVLPNLFGFDYINFDYTLLSFIAFPIGMSYVFLTQRITYIRGSLRQLLQSTTTILLTLFFINITVGALHYFYYISFSFSNFLILNILIAFSYVSFLLIQHMFSFFYSEENTNHFKNNYLNDSFLKGEFVKETGKTICMVTHHLIDTKGTCVIWKGRDVADIIFATGTLKGDDILSLYYEKKTNNSPKHINSFPFILGDKELGVMLVAEKEDGSKLTFEEELIIKEIQDCYFSLFNTAINLKENQLQLNASMEKHHATRTMNDLLIKTQEEEKRTISNWLHDEVLQSLIYVNNTFEQFDNSNNTEINHAKQKIMETIHLIRNKSSDLFPLIVEDLGLEMGLHSLIQKIERSHKINIFLSYHTGKFVFDNYYEIHTYRMIKELLNNVVKHAKAENVLIKISCTSQILMCTIKDDGEGFEAPAFIVKLTEKNHLGLATIHRQIKEFGGEMKIDSVLHEGTIITLKIPMGSERNEGESQRITG